MQGTVQTWRDEEVYNIEVDGDHCYRVGQQGLLVHPMSPWEPVATSADLANPVNTGLPGGFIELRSDANRYWAVLPSDPVTHRLVAEVNSGELSFTIKTPSCRGYFFVRDAVMSEREEVIHEVRKLIKNGATIPKCLRFIGNKLNVSNLVAVDYLRSAFCLGPSMNQKATGGFQRVDADNTQRGLATFLVLLPMIVQHRHEWDDRETEDLGNWFDSLSCSSSQSIAEKALASIRDDKDWANVPPAVRKQYLLAERSRLVLYEYGEMISRLAERLQLRIDELECEKVEQSL